MLFWPVLFYYVCPCSRCFHAVVKIDVEIVNVSIQILGQTLL